MGVRVIGGYLAHSLELCIAGLVFLVLLSQLEGKGEWVCDGGVAGCCEFWW